MKLTKKIFLIFIFILLFGQSVSAAKFSDEMKDFINTQFPKASLRFDGLVTLPDGTLYLPLYPALVKNPDKIEVKESISSDSKHPDVIILNNDYVFMRVIKNAQQQNTLLYMKNPPIEVKTGLLPQDMLVPSSLVIPDNIKGIIGNLQIPTVEDNGLKLEPKREKKQAPAKTLTPLTILKNKVFYISTCYTKNIQVIKANSTQAEYGLEQSEIVYDMKPTPDKKFLLVTNFNKTFVDVISLADDMRIKQIDLTTQGGEILIDSTKNLAYVSSPTASCLYVIDLNTMTLTQKIKLKGKCSKLTLTDNNRKIFYWDQKTNEIWSVELDNDYITQYIGSFPNISKIEYANGKVYLAARVAGRMAIVDYSTLNLITETKINEKPVDMLLYRNYLYILSASSNIVQVLDTTTDNIIEEISLSTGGFSTKIYQIDNSNYALITDASANQYSIIDMDANSFVKNNPIDISVSKMIILPKVRKN